MKRRFVSCLLCLLLVGCLRQDRQVVFPQRLLIPLPGSLKVAGQDTYTPPGSGTEYVSLYILVDVGSRDTGDAAKAIEVNLEKRGFAAVPSVAPFVWSATGSGGHVSIAEASTFSKAPTDYLSQSFLAHVTALGDRGLVLIGTPTRG